MNPYRIDGPALLHISGGRTSGFMLRQILDAHDGKLPDDVVPVFCNTGKEHERTYEFLRDLGTWCPITWLEYTHIDGSHGFRVVSFDNAARNGEPFEAVIKQRGKLPNPMLRFCTAELKIRTGTRFARSLGWTEWDSAVGLRADEPRRVAKIRGDCKAESIVCPMFEAGHTNADVQAFWRTQPFDLRLPGGDNAFGNCDLCFLKSYAKLQKIIRQEPSTADWWAEQEERTDLPVTGDAGKFRLDRPGYRAMQQMVERQGMLFDDRFDEDTTPCHCTD